jgi:DEAD/DEAH box helicase domain-containing protein
MDTANLLVKYQRFPETTPPLGPLVAEAPLSEGLKSALRQQGIKQLFKFQEEAIKAILAGKDVIISAPTATGKTEAFAIPIMEQIASRRVSWGPLRAPKTRAVHALFIYPTKALARDQAKKLAALAAGLDLEVAILDGDTPAAERDRIYKLPPDILITNPDMLHVHLIRPFDPMRQLIQSVRHIVLDEMHIYVGAFGANVHFLLRRLQRLCPPLQLIGASATVSNAREFAELLFGRAVTDIHCETGKKGVIHFLMIYPEQVSQSRMIVSVAQELVRQKFKTLVFANTHRNAEVINIIARRGRISSGVHRAGLPMAYRRKIEEAFRRGNLDLLVSTPTLELGIDIGDLDGVVSMLVGITRLTQRIGRAGRKGQESVAVLALRNKDPISSFYKNNPDEYFTDIDAAFVEPQNEVVARHQLLSAAFDKPLKPDEFPELRHIIQRLIEEELLVEKGTEIKPVMKAARKALRQYSIRGIGDTVRIIHQGKVIGERQMPIAQGELHPGAYYLHAGTTYESVSFESQGGIGRAVVKPVPAGHREMTQAMRHTIPEVIAVQETRQVHGVTAHYADLRMTEVVTGYVIKDIYTDKILKVKELDIPLEYEYETKGLFFTAPVPKEAVMKALSQPSPVVKAANGVSEEEANDEVLLVGAFHALEHTLIESSDMLTGGGRQGIGGVSMGTSGTIFIYDGSPGGSGLAKLLYDRLEEAFRRVEVILQECKCTDLDGCPACTYSYKCGNNNSPLFKAGALEAVSLVIGGAETSVDTEAALSQAPIV